MAKINHQILTPPAKVMPAKMNTKISDTPASPDSTMFSPTRMAKWNTMCITEVKLEILFWCDAITDAMMMM